MSKHSQLNLPPAPLNPVGDGPPTARKSIGEWRANVTRALGRAGLSQKAAAADLGVTEPALSKQLAGLEHLSFWRMFGLPREFWVELVLLLIEFYDLTIGSSPQDQADQQIGRLFREAVQRSRAR